MKKKLLIAVSVLGATVVGVVAIAGFTLKSQLDARFSKVYTVHEVDIVVPWPLSEAELDALRAEKAAEIGDGGDPAGEEAGEASPDPLEDGEAPGVPSDPLEGVDLEAIALERALARGKHLVEARFACIECHGQDFGGGIMVDDGAMGTWKGPNLTAGEGGVVADYTLTDWDRIVRHGVKKDGTAAMMPSEDFVGMSDRELSDIVAYIQSFAPVDAVVPPPSFGPIGFMLAATGELPLSADAHAQHEEHAALPPETEVTAVFGKHLVQVCTGCHRADLVGGPIAIGPPHWPPAGNLTTHEDGLHDWTEADFITAMREGKKKDGSVFLEPMNLMTPYANNMTDVELKALWAYLTSLEAKPTGT